jgi:hypothetical protein
MFIDARNSVHEKSGSMIEIWPLVLSNGPVAVSQLPEGACPMDERS